MILSKGDVAYHGPAGLALETFGSLGYSCPEHENPADYLIDVIVSAESNPDPEPRQRIIQQSKSMQETSLTFKGSDIQSADHHSDRSGFIDQFLILSDRSFKSTIRSPLATFVQLGQAIFMGYWRSFLSDPSFHWFADFFLAPSTGRCQTTKQASRTVWESSSSSCSIRSSVSCLLSPCLSM